MKIAQLKNWLHENEIPDDWEIWPVVFPQSAPSVGLEFEGIKINSGGNSIQLEIYPDGWFPISEGTTRISDSWGD